MFTFIEAVSDTVFENLTELSRKNSPFTCRNCRETITNPTRTKLMECIPLLVESNNNQDARGQSKGPQEQVMKGQGRNRSLRRIEKQDWIDRYIYVYMSNPIRISMPARGAEQGTQEQVTTGQGGNISLRRIEKQD